MMHGRGKSDSAIVVVKPTNKAEQSAAEPVERRAGAEENAIRAGMLRTPSRDSMSNGLDRVRTAARLDKKVRFTALLHHVTVDLLGDAYSWLKRDAASGVDGVTWRAYGEGLSNVLRTFAHACIGARIGHSRRGGRTFRSRTAGNARSA